MIIETQLQEISTTTARRSLTIGLPADATGSEKRFPLTPEGAQILVLDGYRVVVEESAARSIHYSDAAYARYGAEVGSRVEALGCDIVISMGALSEADVAMMRRGSMLFTRLGPTLRNPSMATALLQRNVIAVALDLIKDSEGHLPFSDILAEIDGRASIALASSLLADPEHGKGILLGGVAGVNPCEVVILGSGIAGRAAARSAVGLGAMVRIMDTDIYRLRRSTRELGPGVIPSAPHPRVLMGALHSADIIVVTPMPSPVTITPEMMDATKRGVIIFDLGEHPGVMFPEGIRPVLTEASSAVPRTAAMALSNTLITLLDELVTTHGVSDALKLSPNLQCAVLTFLGRVINPDLASALGMRQVDLSLFLHLS